MKTQVWLSVALVLACAGSACRVSPPSCEEMIPTRMRSLPFDALTRENAPSWIIANVDPGAANLTWHNDYGGSAAWAWSDGVRSYDLVFQAPAVAPNLSLGLRDSSLILSDALRCFGDPQYYRAAKTGGALVFEVWYTVTGIAFQHAENASSSRGRAIAADQPLRTILLAQPGSVTEFARRVYPQLQSPAGQQELLEEVRPWPATFAEVTYTLHTETK